MPNKLASQNSPYLLQHKDNPVDWFPWGEEAFSKAREENKPIFLSIGYAACHWCHVMEHESFEDPATAKIMNTHFINIKVDREERPDIDGIYMRAVVALTGQGGWPMSVFLTPTGEPFFGGTYFPPTRRYNMPAFPELLLNIAAAWKDNPDQVKDSGFQLASHIERANQANFKTRSPLSKEILSQANMNIAQSYDWENGGWGDAPKFPQPMTIRYLLQRASAGDMTARDMAVHSLFAMSRGGIYDKVGGGFSRYSVDPKWLVPHFEKMLYDNAQLARVYLHAYLVSGEEHFRSICEETLDFVTREMTHAQGGFYSSLDADSEGEEGKFYLWTLEEINEILPGGVQLDVFTEAYQISAQGNFEGSTILQQTVSSKALSEKFNIPDNEISQLLNETHQLLLARRNQRIRPATDDKVLLAWNAWMLEAFSEAARYLQREDYLETARRNAQFLKQSMFQDGRLMRSWRDGKALHNAYLEDYASFILALTNLYQSDPDPEWYKLAGQLTEDMITEFSDPAGGFFDTRADHETLISRPKDVQDNATPCGNSLAAFALLKMSAYSGNHDWHERAVVSLSAMQEIAKSHPLAFGNWLAAIDFSLVEVKEIAILGEPSDPASQALVASLWSEFRPYAVAAISAPVPGPGSPPLLEQRTLIDGKPSAYVCQNFTCKLPVTSPQDLLRQINE